MNGRVLPGLALLAALICSPAVTRADDGDSDAALVAQLLARIDGQAARPGGRRALAAELRTLDRLGAHAAAGSDDPSPSWRARAGVTTEPDYRGRVLGPAWRRGWIDPGAVTRIDQQFLAGQKASVAVTAAPSGGLVLGVSDPDKVPVCGEQARSCNWMPLYTQRYTITLRNPGHARLRFYLVVD